MEKNTKAELNAMLTVALAARQLKTISKANLMLLVASDLRAKDEAKKLVEPTRPIGETIEDAKKKLFKAEAVATEVDEVLAKMDAKMLVERVAAPVANEEEAKSKMEELTAEAPAFYEGFTPEFMKEKSEEEHAQLENEYNMKQACLAYAAAKADATGLPMTTFEADLEVSSENPAFVLNHSQRTAYEMDQHDSVGWLVADESKEAYKSLGTSKGINSLAKRDKVSETVTATAGNGSAKKTKNESVSRIEALIGEAKYSMKDVVGMIVDEFAMNPATVQTRIIDSKNPRYNKLRTLVVVQDGKLMFDDNSLIDLTSVVAHKNHPTLGA